MLANFITIYEIVEWVLRLIMLLVLLRRRMASSTKMAWLVVIMAVPIVGVVLYLLIGDVRLGKRRARRHQQLLDRMNMEQRVAAREMHVIHPDVDPSLRNVVLHAERIGGMPIVGGSDVELMGQTDEVIDRLIADIDAAEQHVHMLYYIFRADETGRRVLESLRSAAKRGVTCRLIVDAVGSRPLIRKPVWKQLRQAGVHTVAALPVQLLRRSFARIDLRNHRKLAVIDGRVGFTGSQNIVNADYGHRTAGQWVDLTGRFTGPIVAELQGVFVEDWVYETDEDISHEEIFPRLEPTGEVAAQVVATGPSQASDSLLAVLVTALSNAQKRVIITTPYLVPDEPTMLALTLAAARGVEVQLVLPLRGDHPVVHAAGRSFYGELLDAGVRIHLYRDGLLHAKTITVDDTFALLGSTNLDIRSYYLNFELNVLMYGEAITSRLRFAQQAYLAASDTLTAAAWNARPDWRRYTQRAAALLSPLL